MLVDIELNKGKITEIYAALEFKNENPYRRKPNNTMGIEAKNQFPTVNFSKSIMVGDTDSDILFGKNLGMKTVRVISKEKEEIIPDLHISNLLDLANLLNS
jgi:histidinol phosphatase-like enzyme